MKVIKWLIIGSISLLYSCSFQSNKVFYKIDTDQVFEEQLQEIIKLSDTVLVFAPNYKFYQNERTTYGRIYFCFYRVKKEYYNFCIVAPWGVVYGYDYSHEIDPLMSSIIDINDKLNDYYTNIKAYEPEVIISHGDKYSKIIVALNEKVQGRYIVYDFTYEKNPIEVDKIIWQLYSSSSRVYMGYSMPIKGNKLLGYKEKN
jgi:hypothetical protein